MCRKEQTLCKCGEVANAAFTSDDMPRLDIFSSAICDISCEFIRREFYKRGMFGGVGSMH